ncbi:MAG: hypothetical protein AAGI54_13170 [Planctomycetota bacterium]
MSDSEFILSIASFILTVVALIVTLIGLLRSGYDYDETLIDPGDVPSINRRGQSGATGERAELYRKRNRILTNLGANTVLHNLIFNSRTPLKTAFVLLSISIAIILLPYGSIFFILAKIIWIALIVLLLVLVFSMLKGIESVTVSLGKESSELKNRLDEIDDLLDIKDLS